MLRIIRDINDFKATVHSEQSNLDIADPKQETPAKLLIQVLSDKIADQLHAKTIQNLSAVNIIEDAMVNLLRPPKGRRYSPATIRFASNLKNIGHQRAVSLVQQHGISMPSKKTIVAATHADNTIINSYGISQELISLASKHFNSVGLANALFGLAFDSIFVDPCDSIHVSTQTRHGFVNKTSEQLKSCADLFELLEPIVDTEQYANQVLMFVIFPVSNIGNHPLPIFPIGFVPLCSYNADELAAWLNDAQKQLTDVGIRAIFHSGDNNSAHRSYFSKEFNTSGFPLLDWDFGLPQHKPIPLQDYHHLLRKLISPLLKPKRRLMIGPIPIVQTTFLEAQLALGFPVSFLSQFDEQNDCRVEYFCGAKFLDYLSGREDAIGLTLYLKYVAMLRRAFVDHQITWNARLYLIWQSLTFFVYWHRWIKVHEKKAENFISYETFTAVVQICVGFVLLVRNYRLDLPHVLPWLLSEKPCESFFSTLRSFFPNLTNLTVSECFDIVNRQACLLTKSPPCTINVVAHQQVNLTEGDIKKLLLKAEWKTREDLQQTSLADVIEVYASAYLAYSNQTELAKQSPILCEPNGVSSYPEPAIEATTQQSNGRKKRIHVKVPEITIPKLKSVGLTVHSNGKVSIESLLALLSKRRSTSKTSKNRLERPYTKNKLDQSQYNLAKDLLLLISPPVEVCDTVPPLEDSSEESEVDVLGTVPQDTTYAINNWFWTNIDNELCLAYLAQIDKQTTVQRKEKSKKLFDVRIEIPQKSCDQFRGTGLIVAADVKGNDITFLTDEPIWEEFRLDSIIAAVDHTPKINPWQWQNGPQTDSCSIASIRNNPELMALVADLLEIDV